MIRANRWVEMRDSGPQCRARIVGSALFSVGLAQHHVRQTDAGGQVASRDVRDRQGYGSLGIDACVGKSAQLQGDLGSTPQGLGERRSALRILLDQLDGAVGQRSRFCACRFRA